MGIFEADSGRYTTNRVSHGPGGIELIEKVARDARAQRQLDREHEVLCTIRHPNVVEAVAGGAGAALHTLDAGGSNLEDDPPSTMSEATGSLGLVARVVAELHAAGWAHGNLSAQHLIRGDAGNVTLCSFRRASRIDRPDSPAAAADLDAIRTIATRWQEIPARNAHERSLARRLGRLLEPAAFPATAAELADRLSSLASDTPSTPRSLRRPRRTRQSARRPVRQVRHARPRSPVAGLVLRSLICGSSAVWMAAVANRGGTTAGTGQFTDGLLGGVFTWGALVVAVYGTLLNVVALAAHLSRSERLGRITERAGPSWLRRWLTGLATVGVAATAIPTPTTRPSAPVESVADPVQDTVAEQPTPPTTAASTTTTLEFPDSSPAPDPTTAPESIPPPSPLVGAPRAPLTYTLEPGDHLWSVAERALAMALGRNPTDREVAGYWRKLVDVNRQNLVEPDVPDLVFAGQVITLPPA